MTKPIFHADSESERHKGQPTAKAPLSDKENPDPRTGSGYPAGGQTLEEGRDSYGRGPLQRRQAGLPENVEDEQTARGTTPGKGS